MGNNTQNMRSLLTILSTVVSLVAGQCEYTFPDGTACGAEDFSSQPDPLACWKYYECDAGCVRHLTCEEDFKYDVRHEYCTFPRDVECGDRPCDDPVHCPADITTTTEEPDCSPPDQIIDCRADEYGPGYYPDEYNCRKFWHCLKGESHGDHIMCPQESDDPKATMFDTSYMGCNFPEQTQCGGRPVCDECILNCEAHQQLQRTVPLIVNILSAKTSGLDGFQMSSTVEPSGIVSMRSPIQSTDSAPSQIMIQKLQCLTQGMMGVTSLKMLTVVKGLSVMNAMRTALTPH